MSLRAYRRLLFPLLTLAEAETSHNFVLGLLSAARVLAPAIERAFAVEPGPVKAFGIEFANRVGLAAGFDKNGVAARTIAALGFGHVEVGTVTPWPQPGKPRPRVFRLKEDEALINRLGFPSQGAEAVARNLERLRRRSFVLGVNVGPNADSVGVDGFVQAARRLAPLADYVTVNISSPNTAGLRAMQDVHALDDLLAAVTHAIATPLLVKIAPDLEDRELAEMIEVILSHRVAGVVATNTTIERPATLRSSNAPEGGGLSGRPLAQRSTEVVAAIRRHTGGRLPIVAVGGIATAEDVRAKLDAGATLVQLYTGFIYHGPGVARHINQALARTTSVTQSPL